MERFFVEGGGRLHGEVTCSGAKNAALKLIAAALLAPGRTVLHNVPRIKDVETRLAVLEGLGARCEFSGNTLSIDASTIDSYTAPYDLVRQMRARIVVLGPLVARFGEAEASAPGGGKLGPRKFNFHLDGLRALGPRGGGGPSGSHEVQLPPRRLAGPGGAGRWGARLYRSRGPTGPSGRGDQ